MKGILARIPQTRDLAIGMLLFAVVLLMILPMPTILVDALIGLNFGIAVLLLMTGLYLASPLSLSSLPGIILISTIFRLSLSVTTTRLILAEGDAGAIVQTFGSVVVAGNVVVGMVVFFIITIVQFIVIAKGAERIAEVGARFTLDALPGKQMAIDAELRNGDIDNVEAGHRRKHLERESQFYGAMDGAMKFVKGDAIAGLIIIFVNLFGGLIIGIVQMGMPFGAAMQKYSLLTVGDALISQIPALLMSITAAIIVTRVKGDEERNLGSDIIGQVMSDHRALRLSGCALIVLGVLPGFPTIILTGLGSVFVLGSFAGTIRARLQPPASPSDDVEEGSPPAEEEAPQALLPPEEAQVVLQAALNLFGAYPEGELRARLDRVADEVAGRTGLDACTITAEPVEDMEEDHFRLIVDGTAIFWSSAPSGTLILPDVSEVLQTHDVPFRPIESAIWLRRLEVSAEHADTLDELGLSYLRPPESMLKQVEDGLLRNVSLLIGLQDTRDILTDLEAVYPVLVQELGRLVTIQKVSEVLRRLLDERVSLANKRKVLEAMVEWAPVDASALTLTEYCRIALKQQICESIAHGERVISAIVIERETEDVLRSTLRETNIGTYLVLSEQQTNDLLAVVRRQIETLTPKGVEPVLLTSMDVRRHLKAFLSRNSIDLTVLSFQELSDDYTVVPCSTLTLTSASTTARRSRRQEVGPDDATSPDPMGSPN